MEPLASSADSSASPPPRRRWAGLATPSGLLRIFFVLAVGWAFLQVAYFWRSNRVLWNQGELGPWGVFSGLFRPDWSFSFANSPPAELAAAVLFAGITALLGVLVLRCLDVRASLRVELCLGYIIGAGASGIFFELVTMAGFLRLPFVWAGWIVLLGLAAWFARRRGSQPVLRWWGRTPDPGHQWYWPQLDDPKSVDRGILASGSPTRAEIMRPIRWERGFWWVCALLIAAITLATFWHALFYPETYWDSLILYLGYARMTYLEGAFPFKAEAQVGIGLGANYPHLYPNHGAIGSAMFGAWSDLHQRFSAPLAGLISTVLIYETILLCFGRPAVAIAAALLFRAVPYGIAYSTYASDYSWTIMVTAAFLYLCGLLARSRLPQVFVLLTFLPAMAMHLNYLMGILWVPWGVALLAAFVRLSRRRTSAEQGLTDDHPFDARAWRDALGSDAGARKPEFRPRSLELDSPDATGLAVVLRSRLFWVTLVVCMVLGNTWHVRNYVLTGNPVYAFFPKLFPGSVRINPEVLDSAHLEWFRHGDGIGRLAEQAVDLERGLPERDQNAPGFQRQSQLRHRLKASWQFWQGFETFREVEEDGAFARGLWLDRLRMLLLITRPVPERDVLTGQILPTRSFLGHEVRLLIWPHAYKMAPLALGFALTGIGLVVLLLAFRHAATELEMSPLSWRVLRTLAFSAGTLLFCLLAFHYLLGDFYLYQIIPILVPLAFFGAIPFVFLRGVDSTIEQLLQFLLAALVIAAGLVPGLAMGLLNFKIVSEGQVDGAYYNPFALDHFRHPGLPADTVWGLRFGEDVRMWNDVNDLARHAAVLTHDNRHILYDPSIELVHLDDWDVQQVWGRPMRERLDFFRQRGVRYYLRVPIEFNHPINQRAGIQEIIDAGELQLVVEHGPNQLYEFRHAFDPEYPD